MLNIACGDHAVISLCVCDRNTVKDVCMFVLAKFTVCACDFIYMLACMNVCMCESLLSSGLSFGQAGSGLVG